MIFSQNLPGGIMKKTIALIEDDVDTTTILVMAPDEKLLQKEVNALRETFAAYQNKGFNDPTMPGLAEFDEEGGLGCSFDVCYPIKIAAEVVEDWLSENSTVHEKNAAENTYLYW